MRFNTEQKQQLQKMLQLLQAKKDKKIQVEKMIVLSVLFILQSLKEHNQFTSLIIHFAAVLDIDKEDIWLYKSKKCLFIIAGFLYCIQVLFIKYMLPAATRAEQTQEDINCFLELQQNYLVVGSYCPTRFIIK